MNDEPLDAVSAKHQVARIAILAFFIVAFALFFALGGRDYLDLETIKASRDALLRYTQAHYATAMAIAFCTYATAVALSLPAGLVLSLAIGFLFGRWVGTALIVAAATLGATLLFLAARYVFAEAARR